MTSIKTPLNGDRLTSGIRMAQWLEWVGQSQPRPGAERRHYDPQQPLTPRWLPCVVQQPLDQIASMPATSQKQSVVIVAHSRYVPADADPSLQCCLGIIYAN
jgi:hypothetical protein